MKNSLRTVVAAVGMVASLMPGLVAGQAEVLNNQSIVQMVTGKVPKNLILEKIRTTTGSFDVTPNALIALNKSKVSDDVIEAMMRTPTKVESKEVITNDAVILMVSGKLPKKIILLKIQLTKSKFDVTPAGLVSLTQNKVSADVQKAMMTAASLSKPSKT